MGYVIVTVEDITPVHGPLTLEQTLACQQEIASDPDIFVCLTLERINWAGPLQSVYHTRAYSRARGHESTSRRQSPREHRRVEG